MGKGQNVGLGRLRESLNLNDPTKAFAFRQLEGQMAKIKVDHQPDKEDPEKVYDRVVGVTKA